MADRIMPRRPSAQRVEQAQTRILPKRRAEILNGVGRTINTYAFPQRPAPLADSKTLAIIGPSGTIAQRFPGYEAREPQIRLALAIEAAIRDRKHFAAEAGTGVGKSFAYLAAALASKRKTAVAVPTLALMDQLLSKDIPFLSMAGVIPGGFTYALLKGRANYLCLHKYEQFKENPTFENRQDAGVWRTVQTWTDETRDGDTGKLTIALPMAIKTEITATSDECLGETCPAYDRCYAEQAKARAAGADLIVTNLAMLMRDISLRADTDDMASILPDGIETLVIDECHRLEDEALNALTREVTVGRLAFVVKRVDSLIRRAASRDVETRQAQELLDAIEAGREPVSVTASTLIADWKARTDRVVNEFDAMLAHYVLRLDGMNESAARLGDEYEVMLDSMLALDALVTDMITFAPASLQDTDRESWDKLANYASAFLGDLIAASGATDRSTSVVRYVAVEETKTGKRATIKTTPVNVAPALRSSLWTASFYRPFDRKGNAQARLPLTVIAVSATIATSNSMGGQDLRFWRERVGLDYDLPSRPGLIVGSPFDYRHNALTYVPLDAAAFNSTVARKDPAAWAAYLDRLAAEYRRLITISGGRAFALFTSNTVLDSVLKATRADFEAVGIQVLRQGEAPQTELVRRFRERPSVLFGVKSFWEGVDIQGEALSLVVISGLPFTPPSDPVFAAQCAELDRKYSPRASFRLLSIPQATIALKQAYGRGIRSGSDRAVMAILDGRLRSNGYGASILSALPDAPITGEIDDVARFFVISG